MQKEYAPLGRLRAQALSRKCVHVMENHIRVNASRLLEGNLCVMREGARRHLRQRAQMRSEARNIWHGSASL